MIIEQKQTHEISGSDFLTIETSVNKNKLAKLYGILSDIYRNPIGSIVREYASNAYDANKEAYNFATLTYEECCRIYKWMTDPNMLNINMNEDEFNELKSNISKASGSEPIVVGIDNSNSPVFYIKDYGIGLSPQRMKNIYFNYLDSTKEDNDDEIGGFGIGAKSALSYTHTFFIDTVYNGKEYRYIMSKNSVGIPIGQLLVELEGCDKPNGTLIKIPVNSSDISTFISEIGKQLAYMDNVYIENIDYKSYGNLNIQQFNDSKILKSQNWKYNMGHQPLNQLHLSLENITYSIDWSELGMNSINVPFALEFKTGELQPTPSRESIVYSKDSIELIKKKIDVFVTEFVDKYNSLYQPTQDYYFWQANKNKKPNLVEVFSDIKSVWKPVHIDMNTLLQNYPHIKFNDLNEISYKPFDDIGLTKNMIPYDLFFDYRITRKVDCFTGRSASYNAGSTANILKSCKIVFADDGVLSEPLKNYYILDNLVNKESFYFLRKNKRKLKTYVDFLNIKKIPKSQWRNIISGYQKIIESIIMKSSIGEYDSIHVNPNWYKDFKAGKSKYSPKRITNTLNEDEINVSSLGMNAYSNSFGTHPMKMKDIFSFPGIVVYGSPDDKSKLLSFSKMMLKVNSFLIKLNKSQAKPKSIMVFHTSKTNCKKIKKIMTDSPTPLPNISDIDSIMSSNFRAIKRVATCLYLGNFYTDFYYLTHFKSINTDIYNKYIQIIDYINNNSNNGSHTTYSLNLDEDFKKEVLLLADTLKLYDNDILSVKKEIDDYLKNAEIVSLVKLDGIDEDSLNIVIKYLKSIKKPVNKQYYLKSTHQLLEQLITNKYEDS